MTINFLDLKFDPVSAEECKSVGVSDGFIAGWASTPDLDTADDIVVPGAFDASIAERGLTGPRSIKLLVGHKREQVAGIIRKLETRQGRLWIEADVNLNISYARDAYEAAKTVGGLNFSVGFLTQEYDFGENGIRIIRKADLREVSIVSFPANDECVMTTIKSEDVETLSDFEKYLISLGLVQSRNAAHRVTQAVKEHARLFESVKDIEMIDNVVDTQTDQSVAPDLSGLHEALKMFKESLR